MVSRLLPGCYQKGSSAAHYHIHSVFTEQTQTGLHLLTIQPGIT